MCKECECQSDRNCGCGASHDSCGCGGHSFERRYQTKTEQTVELEAYLGDLKAEVQAVEEHLAALR
jgi:hypothetical protein